MRGLSATPSANQQDIAPNGIAAAGNPAHVRSGPATKASEATQLDGNIWGLPKLSATSDLNHGSSASDRVQYHRRLRDLGPPPAYDGERRKAAARCWLLECLEYFDLEANLANVVSMDRQGSSSCQDG
ncbi:hypothetical protein KEM55_004255 [Ascosphaera atra]|nr:hypothetical protein KEM55_004255 [Ascosphaera atra]